MSMSMSMLRAALTQSSLFLVQQIFYSVANGPNAEESMLTAFRMDFQFALSLSLFDFRFAFRFIKMN